MNDKQMQEIARLFDRIASEADTASFSPDKQAAREHLQEIIDTVTALQKALQ